MADQNTSKAQKVIRYQFEVDGTSVLQPKPVPQPKPRRKPVPRPKYKPKREVYRNNNLETLRVRAAEAISPLAIAGMIAVVLLAAMILQGQIELNSLNSQVVSLRSELSTLQETQSQLDAQYEQLFDMQGIESDMLNSGMMIKTGSSQQIYLDMSEPDVTTVYQTETQLLDLIESLFSRVTEFFG